MYFLLFSSLIKTEFLDFLYYNKNIVNLTLKGAPSKLKLRFRDANDDKEGILENLKNEGPEKIYLTKDSKTGHLSFKRLYSLFGGYRSYQRFIIKPLSIIEGNNYHLKMQGRCVTFFPTTNSLFLAECDQEDPFQTFFDSDLPKNEKIHPILKEVDPILEKNTDKALYDKKIAENLEDIKMKNELSELRKNKEEIELKKKILDDEILQKKSQINKFEYFTATEKKINPSPLNADNIMISPKNYIPFSRDNWSDRYKTNYKHNKTSFTRKFSSSSSSSSFN